LPWPDCSSYPQLPRNFDVYALRPKKWYGEKLRQ
jgi:hypothetical protein